MKKKLLTKEINVMTGLCLYDYSEDLVEKVIKHFPTWRLYKVKYKDNKQVIDGLFITNLKFFNMKDIKREEEIITERYNGLFIVQNCEDFKTKYQNKIEKFMDKNYTPWTINFVAVPKGCEILNLGTDDLTFR